LSDQPNLSTLFAQLLELNSSESLAYGFVDLAHNNRLIEALLQQYCSSASHIPTFSQFMDCVNGELPPPKAPDPDNPKFDPQPDQWAKFNGPKWQNKKSQIAAVIKAQNLSHAQDQYHQRRSSHAQVAERSRAIAQVHKSDHRGYRSFLCDPTFEGDDLAFPSSLPAHDRNFFISSPEFRLKEFDRQRHTYITAETGHGKSVAIETLIHHYLHQDYSKKPKGQPCLILIDPHGDLAQSVASFKNPDWMKDWLVYVKPALGTDITPSINPFELQSKDWNDIALATDAFIEVFREVMRGDKDGVSFSPQMVTILKPVIATLLHMDHTTVADIIPFLSDERADYETYLNHARQHLTNPSQLEFLKRDFFKDSYNPSKLSIKTKIRNLLSDDYFLNFLCGPTTVKLDEHINRRSVILFDLSSLTEASSIAIGRFIMATLIRFAFAQGEKPYHERVPIHLFIDECQDFISDSMKQIVTKTRKFRLHGTFAQQFCGQGMNTELRRAIIGNSRIKITGKNETTSLKMISAETGATVDELQSLSTGEFHIKAGKAPSVAVKIPMIKINQRISKPEWESRLADQKDRYYRQLETRSMATSRQDKNIDRNNEQTASGPRRRRPAYSIKS